MEKTSAMWPLEAQKQLGGKTVHNLELRRGKKKQNQRPGNRSEKRIGKGRMRLEHDAVG